MFALHVRQLSLSLFRSTVCDYVSLSVCVSLLDMTSMLPSFNVESFIHLHIFHVIIFFTTTTITTIILIITTTT